LLSLLPIVLVVLLFGVFAKLAARFFRRTKLDWSRAFILGLLVTVTGTVGSFINSASGLVQFKPLGFMVGILLQLAVGGWYLGANAKTEAGDPILFKGGILLTLITYLLAIAFSGLMGVVLALIFKGSVPRL
jgi:hypothetical protein